MKLKSTNIWEVKYSCLCFLSDKQREHATDYFAASTIEEVSEMVRHYNRNAHDVKITSIQLHTAKVLYNHEG